MDEIDGVPLEPLSEQRESECVHMHWADHAAKILSQRGVKQTIASGITPSGSFHIGHLREILTAEMIHRACQDIGLESRYIFIVDSMDPLRRVYSFLHEDYNSTSDTHWRLYQLQTRWEA